MHDGTLSVFITNLGKYNEGELVGDWLKLPTDYETLHETLKDIGIGGRYEEWFITDYECSISGMTDYLGEYENLDELNYMAELIYELSKYDEEKLEAVLDYESPMGASNVIEIIMNLDDYSVYSSIEDDEDLGRYYIEELDALDVPEHLRNYIDYEAYGRDVRFSTDGNFTSYGWVEDTTNGHHSQSYDGLDDIPDEYIITRKVDDE